MNAAEHLETHLGQMARGWSSASLPGVQICLFRDQPVPGVSTLATLGLSNTPLLMSQDRQVRQELLLSTNDNAQIEGSVRLLMAVAEQMLERGRALLRGDVVHVGSTPALGGNAGSLYVSMPVVFGDAIATLNDTSPATVFVWLFPVYHAEAVFIKSSGWGEFENLLEAADPDLFDVRRKSVVE